MEFTYKRTLKSLAVLLLLAALTQPIYTLLYKYAPDMDRKFLWQFEALVFTLMAAFAGAAMVSGHKRFALGFSAIAFSAVLNVIQVGIGLLQFGPFRAASQAYEELGPMAFSVIALSFFLYNAAKALLGLAAVAIGTAAKANGKSALGLVTIIVGAVALVSNALVMMFGIQGFFPRPVAGVSGVAAALLLALCVFGINGDETADA